MDLKQIQFFDRCLIALILMFCIYLVVLIFRR